MWILEDRGLAGDRGSGQALNDEFDCEGLLCGRILWLQIPRIRRCVTRTIRSRRCGSGNSAA